MAGGLAFVFANGLLAHRYPPLRPLALAATTPLLLVANVAVLLAIFDDHRARRLRYWCLGAWGTTVVLEMVGVATGKVFGPYHYGATLRGQVAGVPLLIGLNWTTLLLGALAWLEVPLNKENRLTPRSSLLAPILAAALLTGFDWVMEPVAVALDYWQWHTWPRIPARNYAAWFGIALGAGFVFQALGLRVHTGLARFYFAAQLLFFVLLRFLLPC